VTSPPTASAPGWTAQELDLLGSVDEIRVASRRRDGTLRPTRIVWAVRHGAAVYVRSVNGIDAAWYRGVQTRHEGHITAAGLAQDVRFVEVDHTPGNPLDTAVDAAYRAKYRRWPGAVGHITSREAAQTTLRLEPTQHGNA
jgi:hypothetical protein